MTHGVMVIDIQQDYFQGGAHPLVDPDAAAQVARSVVDDARGRGEWVGHLQHQATEPDATFLIAGTPGGEIHPLLTPAAGEPVITKKAPNSFVGTGLADTLAAAGVDDLTVVGMMSSMCVDATVRAALDLGLSVTVVENGCAAPDLVFQDTVIPGSTVHAAFMAALAGAGATVISA
ncbi:MAG: cysteine hydrolase family protein [Nakamurella sp.]